MTNRLSRTLHIAVLVAVAALLTFPFLVDGLARGHDRRVHIEYQHLFNEQMAAGEFYPRWMPKLNMGRGSPVFFVQYPLPYYVAWGLGHLIPNHWGMYTETRTLGLGVVLATILGALFTYAWCATFVDSLSATLAAFVFLTLPYFFSVDLYIRAAVGEIWAIALMPLALYFVERRSALGRRYLAGIAGIFGLVLLSHLFTAMLFAPVLFVYAVWRAEPTKRLSALRQTAGALTLGSALAGVYVLPLFAHRHFLHPENIPAILGSNYSPLSQMFPYDRSMFPRQDPTWHSLSLSARYLAAATICLIGVVCYRLRRERAAILRILLAAISIAVLAVTFLAGHLPGLGEIPGALALPTPVALEGSHIFLGTFLTLLTALLCYWSLKRRTDGELADFLIVVALLSYWMMTRWSLVVWNHIHALWGIQFPWRFNVILALATSGLVAIAIADLRKLSFSGRALASALGLMLWVFVAVATALAEDTEEAFWDTRPVAYRPAQDPAFPVYAQVKSLDETLDIVKSTEVAELSAIVTSGSGRAQASMPRPRLIEVHALCQSDCTLRISQYYYPAWRARLMPSGIEIPLRPASPGGLMEISLPAGGSSLAIELPRDWSEQAGPWVSLGALILILGFGLNLGQPKHVR